MLRFSVESQSGSDVIGTLRIDGRGSSIEVPSAYLDSWLAGVVECVSAAVRGVETYVADVVEESSPLSIRALGGELLVRFGDQTAELGPLEPAVREIAGDVAELLQRYPLQNTALLEQIESGLSTL